jgi:multidrug resistance protein, MATE family
MRALGSCARALTPGVWHTRLGGSAYLEQSSAGHIKATVRLAWPITVSRIGILTLFAADTAMTGRVSATELAYLGLALAPQLPLLLLGMGLVMGAAVLVAQAVGAREDVKAGHLLRVSLRHAWVAGAVMVVICLTGDWIFAWSGQSADNVAGASVVLAATGWGLPPALIFAACASFLEAIGRPLPGMLAMLAANVVNIGLNWILVFGNLGVAASGASGAAYATSASRWFAVVLLFIYFWRYVDRARFGLTGKLEGAAELGRRMRAVGWPLSAAHGLETAAFSVMTLFAGWAGVAHVAIYQITLNMMGLVFMIALGLGGAASVRVARAVGRGANDEVRRAGGAAIAIGLTLAALFALMMFVWPELLTRIYSDDPAVLALAVATLSVAAIASFADCAHGVTMGALRGTGDIWPATMMYLFAFWCVMLPAGYYLSAERGMGAPGLLIGVAIGTALASLLLGGRFYIVSGRHIARR